MKNTTQNWIWIARLRLTAAAALTFAAVLVLPVIIATQSAQAQTYTVVATFDGTNGNSPLAPLVQATNGNLYGTTQQNGFAYGTVFDVTTNGTLTSLYSFCPSGPPCVDGSYPVAGLVLAANGDLYGTTESGGMDDSGTAFKITLTGTRTTLFNFSVEDADSPDPEAGLVQASNGNLYGAVQGGGVNGAGTLFMLTPTGKLRTIYSFCSNPTSLDCTPTSISAYDGWGPLAGLTQATNGYFYGTTSAGGNSGVTYGAGTVFKISAGGAFTVLYRFCSQVNNNGTCTDGGHPASALVQATNGSLYGTTYEGGSGAACPDDFGCGTIFQITPAGALTTLYSFCSLSNCADGQNGGVFNDPQPSLIQATDGNLYGTTPFGGSNGYGTIFEFNTTTGTLTTLYNFCSQNGCADGGQPVAGLIQDTNGNFYGTTSSGVAGNPCYEYGCGTVFSLSMGLGPFVEALPASTKADATINILGTDLTGATSVAFDGMTAAFTVVSNSDIIATIPADATTGYVTVTTPSGTLTSNVPEIVNGKLISTTTTLSSSPNPSTFGEAVTLTAVVASNSGAPPNGETVSFMKGTTLLGKGVLSNGSASFTTSTLTVGATPVKAVYGGDAYFVESNSNVVRQVVDKAGD
jgi:uncharacterized repeat protein (TIGR03803 family)